MRMCSQGMTVRQGRRVTHKNEPQRARQTSPYGLQLGLRLDYQVHDLQNADLSSQPSNLFLEVDGTFIIRLRSRAAETPPGFPSLALN